MGLQSFLWLFLCMAVSSAVPAPGRIPKVYNALITSNQNLEPSKAFPVYQPVLHNTFPFPLQAAVYHQPLANGFLPRDEAYSIDEKSAEKSTEKPSEIDLSTSRVASDEKTTENPFIYSKPSSTPESDATSALPPVPKTESPIPLNEFGFPPQILPLSSLNPGYQFTQLAYPYTYPGLRFYDPYDRFGFHPYGNWPFYHPLSNFLGQPLPLSVKTKAPVISSAIEDKPASPLEPSDLNVLNYSAKDPAIPNVPPPPLPQGGLKSDKE